MQGLRLVYLFRLAFGHVDLDGLQLAPIGPIQSHVSGARLLSLVGLLVLGPASTHPAYGDPEGRNECCAIARDFASFHIDAKNLGERDAIPLLADKDLDRKFRLVTARTSSSASARSNASINWGTDGRTEGECVCRAAVLGPAGARIGFAGRHHLK
jgi:hypothetical protein